MLSASHEAQHTSIQLPLVVCGGHPSQSQLYNMPCDDGTYCLMPESAPDSTGHKCRRCGISLHGICGTEDPSGDNEMHRICTECNGVSSTSRKAQATHGQDVLSSQNNMAEELMSKEPTGTEESDDGACSDEGERGLENTAEGPDKQGPARYVPYQNSAQAFSEIERDAQQSNLREVLYHIGKARMLWLEADGKRKTKQTDLHPYFC